MSTVPVWLLWVCWSSQNPVQSLTVLRRSQMLFDKSQSFVTFFSSMSNKQEVLLNSTSQLVSLEQHPAICYWSGVSSRLAWATCILGPCHKRPGPLLGWSSVVHLSLSVYKDLHSTASTVKKNENTNKKTGGGVFSHWLPTAGRFSPRWKRPWKSYQSSREGSLSLSYNWHETKRGF